VHKKNARAAKQGANFMQTNNANPPIRITGRHVTVTGAMKEYLRRKIAGLHIEYPRIIEVHAILDVEKYRHIAEVVLRCCNHITIKAGFESEDVYASIDQAVDRIARKMRKYHTRLLRRDLPRRHSVRTGPIEIREHYS
jgi:ribosome hibernation promoting factor